MIAPFIYSLLRISLGIVIYDVHILFKSLLVTLQSLFLALALSTLLGFIFQYYPSQLEYIGQMIGTNILFPSFCVALISGATGTYAFMKPKVDEVLPGVAI